MNRLDMILGFAHQGLSTAVIMLRAAAKKAKDSTQAAKLLELARVLDAADSGIADYLENDD